MPSKESNVRVAVIGVGRMGCRHIDNAKSLGFEIIGIADPLKSSLQEAAKRVHLPDSAIFLSAESLLSASQPDCLIIASTAPSHAAITCSAARNGIPYILCEKPMAVSIAQCDLMIETCRTHNVRLAVNHEHRFSEQYRTVKRLANEDRLGGIRSINLSAGNVGIAMNGSHYIDLFRFLTHEEPEEVCAWFSREKVLNPRGAEYEEMGGQFRLRGSKDTPLLFDALAGSGHGFKMILNCGFGQILVDELVGKIEVACRKPEDRALPTTRYGTPADSEIILVPPSEAAGPSRVTLSALLNGDPIPSGEEGRTVIETLVAAYISHESGGRPVLRSREALPLSRTFSWA